MAGSAFSTQTPQISLACALTEDLAAITTRAARLRAVQLEKAMHSLEGQTAADS
jgi:hypothetical protein